MIVGETDEQLAERLANAAGGILLDLQASGEFVDSAPQYASYLKQALLGASVPGATAAAGGLAAQKAAEKGIRHHPVKARA